MNTFVDPSLNESFTRHGGCYNRGTCDSYYGRPPVPHYYIGDTFRGTRVEEQDMTDEEIAAYLVAYERNEERGYFKEFD